MDIYFEDNYGKLYEKSENGRYTVFRHECEYGLVVHRFIKRHIPAEIYDYDCFDLITPYGYGGPLIERCTSNDDGIRQQLVASFAADFERYCLKENIISEFVRFNPFENNAYDFRIIYSARCIRHTLGTNLGKYDDPVNEEFTSHCRKNIRRALRRGISYRITEGPENLDEFAKIYYQTMERCNASSFYYFDRTYFDSIIRNFRKNILLIEALYEGKTIAASLCFLYNNRIHIHLSGTLKEYLSMSPAYILRYAAVKWGKENGFEMIHHGGGRSDRSDDSLFMFKKQFAVNTEFEYCIGKKIWDSKVYDDLTRFTGADPSCGFFPLYRSCGGNV